MSARRTIHANCVVIGEAGVLIRGASGSGKSSLSAALIEQASARGLFARLVADDRLFLDVRNGRLIASPPPALAGLMERRGVGVVSTPYLSSAVISTVVDIEDAPARMPAPSDMRTVISEVELTRIVVARNAPDAASIVLASLNLSLSGTTCDPSALAFATQHGKMPLSAPHAPSIRTGRARVARGGPEPERNEFCAENA